VTLFSRTTVQLSPLAELQPFQVTELELPVGVPDRTIVAPVVNAALQVDGDEQSIPEGKLVTVPVAVPLKLTVKIGCGPAGVHPELAGPSTVIADELLTTRFEPSSRLAVISATPQPPLGLAIPALVIATTCGLSDAHVTCAVTSLFAGG
jgi:hypothetical protein